VNTSLASCVDQLDWVCLDWCCLTASVEFRDRAFESKKSSLATYFDQHVTSTREMTSLISRCAEIAAWFEFLTSSCLIFTREYFKCKVCLISVLATENYRPSGMTPELCDDWSGRSKCLTRFASRRTRRKGGLDWTGLAAVLDSTLTMSVAVVDHSSLRSMWSFTAEDLCLFRGVSWGFRGISAYSFDGIRWSATHTNKRTLWISPWICPLVGLNIIFCSDLVN